MRKSRNEVWTTCKNSTLEFLVLTSRAIDQRGVMRVPSNVA